MNHPELEKIHNLSDKETIEAFKTWFNKAKSEGLQNTHLSLDVNPTTTNEAVMRELLAIEKGNELGLWKEFSPPKDDTYIPNHIDAIIQGITFKG
jgi:hypothetical protein